MNKSYNLPRPPAPFGVTPYEKQLYEYLFKLADELQFALNDIAKNITEKE